ncbi:hypothetical protein PUNSTDRAFT_93504 [Punctularia strigosozonata HHB-11173 SS5]|uniref:CNH domain-containing protein n=1 Tax=Punctularia strigosozonata (strain HHB-11173) TaxID=741275 RepID=R7S2G4_PUNST|nr:uncharacterized protein PUNSTDRAFT_93504 [Punctularia strigosozonata HHB-11173 SS5]EIN04044.1 hypothetical protein PUNSTDRAFT_93504 [Punctularia strigosozonata HHB-11173 SS5]
MAPFLTPTPIINGFKEKVESLLIQGDRLYIGTSTGNLHIYSVDGRSATLLEVKQNLFRRAIEQLGFVKEINSLVVLSESLVTLYPLPTLHPPTALPKTKSAFSFAVHSSVQHTLVDGSKPDEGDFDKAGKAKTVPTVVSYLAVGCKRKVVVYSWKDGEPEEPKETVLDHSARTMTFVNDETICLGYPHPDFAMFNVTTMTVVDFTFPPTASTSVPGISNVSVGKGIGMGAISGLGGYIGLGAKVKPQVVRINDNEVLVGRDNAGIFFGLDGKPSRPSNVEWPAIPDEIGYVRPYIFSALPPGSTSVSSLTSTSPTSPAAVHIRSSIFSSDTQSQLIPFPFDPSHAKAAPEQYVIRVLVSAPQAKSPLLAVTTPTDRTTASTEGSSIWRFEMKPWGEQIDELVAAGAYSDALALVNSLEEALLPDKSSRISLIRGLNAVSKFAAGEYDVAMDTFIELDINPAKVVALYPEPVAGRLSVPQDAWIHLFGGPQVSDNVSATEPKEDKHDGSNASQSDSVSPSRVMSPVGSISNIRDKLKTGLDAIRPSFAKDDDTASISGKRKAPIKDEFTRSVETLLRYLSDRRPKVGGALGAFHITPAQSHQIEALSKASVEDLFDLPNLPLSALTPDQLVRYAQIVDTALFKSYLIVRPGLIGALCRVENWCEVTEVEEVLRSRQKYAELIDLYHGKKMHDKALDLLRSLSEQEDDVRDKLQPSITYLQRLGPEYMQLILQSSQWLLTVDPGMALEVFTCEEPELPREPIADFLEGIDPQICARYLEHLIEEREEESPIFHDRLADLYLSMTLAAKKRNDEKTWRVPYAKLLRFIETTDRYQTDRLFGHLPNDDLYEARAILLGRLGRHVHALELYVYRLQDYMNAEEYCKRIYLPDSDTEDIFLSLLRIYLQPTVKTSANLLLPALDLIRRHSPRLDPVESLNLLPPLVTTQDVRKFLMDALRAPVFDTQVVREISKARNEQISRTLMALQSKRVKITDTRMCPQCHKRLGNSVIAVHAPRGEVTHYQCREAFSQKLGGKRH